MTFTLEIYYKIQQAAATVWYNAHSRDVSTRKERRAQVTNMRRDL